MYQFQYVVYVLGQYIEIEWVFFVDVFYLVEVQVLFVDYELGCVGYFGDCLVVLVWQILVIGVVFSQQCLYFLNFFECQVYIQI